jgi:hypothetical protein
VAKQFKTDTAMYVVGRHKNNIKTFPDTDTAPNPLYKDYYSLTDGKPISFDTNSSRLKSRLNELERTQGKICLDLFFLWSGWDSFYSRTDSFSRFLKEEILVSRSFAYGIINSVQMLVEYYQHQTGTDLADFMSEIAAAIEDVGISKLILVSNLKNKVQKHSLVEKLIEGEDISVNELKAIPKEKRDVPPVVLQGKDIIFEGEIVLTFGSDDEALMKSVQSSVQKYYQKHWGK